MSLSSAPPHAFPFRGLDARRPGDVGVEMVAHEMEGAWVLESLLVRVAHSLGAPMVDFG